MLSQAAPLCAQVMGLAQDHAKALQRLSSDLEALAPRSSVGTCTRRDTMLGFYSLLEQQLGSSGVPAASSSSSSSKDAAGGVWKAWREQFVQK